jgi:hypothetical protein
MVRSIHLWAQLFLVAQGYIDDFARRDKRF